MKLRQYTIPEQISAISAKVLHATCQQTHIIRAKCPQWPLQGNKESFFTEASQYLPNSWYEKSWNGHAPFLLVPSTVPNDFIFHWGGDPTFYVSHDTPASTALVNNESSSTSFSGRINSASTGRNPKWLSMAHMAPLPTHPTFVYS